MSATIPIVGAPYARHVGHKLSDTLYDHGQVVLCQQRGGGVGRVPFVRQLASLSLQWPLMFFVIMPRQYMLSDCIIISGLYHVGPNSSASENL